MELATFVRGERSGTAGYYMLCNEEIRCNFRNGVDMKQLIDQYGLSMDSIRKIVYSRT
ncbi:hypothetical protein [Paenibacillus donghaensis]|uniref:hypothetical protein n=1 Tax=Paenibacillus donghaensis TaxID=414771 RepID=UPI0012F779F0|nr:hypothetical protein [Paenibacillus donghaensis]